MVKVIVTKPGPKAVVVVDDDGRLLLLTTTYNKSIPPGEYEDPIDVVEIFNLLATRGQETTKGVNHEKVYEVLVNILRSNLPMRDKIREVYKYVRAARR